MTIRQNDPGRAGSGSYDRADPAGADAAQGTPPPHTPLDTGRDTPRGGHDPIPDPDYGIDPQAKNAPYSGAGRGSDDMVADASRHQAALEGASPRGNAAAPGTTGQLRGGDTTSTANSHENMAHGLGESGATGAMPQGVAEHGAAGRHDGAAGGVDPHDESTFEEGQQHAQGSRA